MTANDDARIQEIAGIEDPGPRDLPGALELVWARLGRIEARLSRTDLDSDEP